MLAALLKLHWRLVGRNLTVPQVTCTCPRTQSSASVAFKTMEGQCVGCIVYKKTKNLKVKLSSSVVSRKWKFRKRDCLLKVTQIPNNRPGIQAEVRFSVPPFSHLPSEYKSTQWKEMLWGLNDLIYVLRTQPGMYKSSANVNQVWSF